MMIWSQIYKENIWNGTETLSGPGSNEVSTRIAARDIVHIVSRYGIRNVLDAACGEGSWMPTLPGYVGMDIAPEAILRAKARHPGRQFVVADMKQLTSATKFDLVILRDVIQHVSLAEGKEMLDAAFRVGRFVLASSYMQGKNTGIDEADALRGKAYDNDLTQPPFGLPQPMQVIPDGYEYDEPLRIRDPRKVLGLWKA
jgi:SAM-dependent methyltransferase